MKTLVGSPEPPPEPDERRRLLEAFKRLREKSVRQVNELRRQQES